MPRSIGRLIGDRANGIRRQPQVSVAELRAHWRQQQEQRLAFGLGKAGAEDLVFARADGTPWPPDSLTADWARTVRLLKLLTVTFHALTHTHVSQLIAGRA